MGWFGRKPQDQQQAGPAIVRPVTVPRSHSEQVLHAWAVRIEGMLFHVCSLLLAGVSALAIWQIFVSRHAGDWVRIIEGGVVALCFCALGYFLSRNIAYRLMLKQMIWTYTPLCLLVEGVEIYCNYVVGVSYLDLSEFFQTIPASQHAFLLTAGRIVVSCIPAVSLFSAVAQMDLERRKLAQAATSSPQAVRPGGTYAAGYPNQQQQQAQRRPLREQQAYQPQTQQQNGANPPQGVRTNQ